VAEKELSQYGDIAAIGAGTKLAVLEGGRNAQASSSVLAGFVDSQIAATGLQDQVDDLTAGVIDGSAIAFPTWAQALVAANSGEIPVNRHVAVVGDAGTHVDPVTGDTVSNSGRFVMTDGGLQWRSPDSLKDKIGYQQFIGDLDASLVGPAQVQAIGTQAVGAGTAISSSTFVFGVAAVEKGYIRRVRAYGAPGASREIKLRVFQRTGNDWQAVGADVPVIIAPGLNDLRVNIPIEKGQYIGFYTPVGGIMFVNASGTGYYNAAGDLTSFTDATATATIQLQIGFEIQYWPFDAATIANLVGADALVKASFPVADGVVADRPFNGSNFPPPTFTGWAFMLAAGPDFPAGVRLSGVRVKNLNLGAAAATLRIRRSTRKLTDAWLNSPPGTAGDVFLDQTDFNVAGNSLPVGSYRDVELQLPEVVGAADMVVIHEMTALDADGAAATLGIGRATLEGAPQYRLGFFKQAAGWVASTTTGAAALALIGKLLTVPPAEAGGDNEPRARAPGCVGVHGHVGRFEYPFNNATTTTHRLLQAVPAEFDGVRLVLAHGSPKEVKVGGASIKAVAAVAAVADNTGHTRVTFNGKAAVTMPAAEGSKGISFVVSDLMPISSVARSDGGALPLVVAQAVLETPGSIALMGSSTGSIDRRNWANRVDDPWIARQNTGDCVTTPANFTSVDNQSTTCIAGVVFVARGQVVAVVGLGDSITNGEGGGITYQGASFLYEGVMKLNRERPVAYSLFNVSWSGSGTETFLRRLQSAVAAGLSFDVACLSPWSPNDIATVEPTKVSTITTAHIASMRLRLGEQLNYCQRYGIRPVVWTGLPTDPGAKKYGATDSLRRGFNAQIRAMGSQGVVAMDLDAAVAGETDADGQVHFRAGQSGDQIHLGNAGIATCADYPWRAFPTLALEWEGALVAPIS